LALWNSKVVIEKASIQKAVIRKGCDPKTPQSDPNAK
jgi:hypothetical protein